MLYFLLGFLISSILFLLYIFLAKKEQKNIAFQLDLILQKNSSCPIKTSKYVIDTKLIEKLNTIIQQLLLQKKEFETTKQNLKDMTTSISHDFRTPLTSISGYIQVLLDEDNISKKDKLKYLNIIQNRTNSLSALVEDFYSITSVDSFDYPFDVLKINISNIFKQIIANYYNELEEVYENIIVDINTKDAYIKSDKIAIERIFSNLLKNSFSYGTKNIYLKLYENYEKNSYYIIIANNLKENIKVDINTIFKRNYSVNWANGNKSTGLGLAIAKSLVEKSNGSIISYIKDNMIYFELSFPKVL